MLIAPQLLNLLLMLAIVIGFYGEQWEMLMGKPIILPLPMARKKSATSSKLFAVLILAVTLLLAIMLFHRYRPKPSRVHYDAFGIAMPTQYQLHGIDVSRYQKTIGWQLVKEMEVDGISISFAFIKATEGTLKKDPQFERNWQQAAAQKMVRGAYHYFLPSKNGKAQAQHFIQNVSLSSGDLPPVLDIEETHGLSKTVLLQQLNAWVSEVEQHYGIKPIIYTNAHFYEKYLAGSFDHYPLWVAHYQQQDQPRIGRHWHFWQHSETGRVNGIDAPVDLNVFNGNIIDFENLLLP